MCKHYGSSEQSGSYTTLSSLNNLAVHPTWKKKKIIARNKENGKQNLDRLCTIHYETSLYTAGCKEKIAEKTRPYSEALSKMN